MSNEIEFVDGLRLKAPHENAPDFVKASISIERKVLGNWLRGKDDDWINIDVKESKNGKWYAAVNDWKPEPRQEPENKPEPIKSDDELSDDIPF